MGEGELFFVPQVGAVVLFSGGGGGRSSVTAAPKLARKSESGRVIIGHSLSHCHCHSVTVTAFYTSHGGFLQARFLFWV